MLRIDTEFRKGIFFIRLNGRLNNEENLETVNKLIENIAYGIRGHHKESSVGS